MDISIPKVSEALVLYGILHSIVWVIMKIVKPIEKGLEYEVKRLIASHRIDGHKDRLGICKTGDCAKLVMKNQQQAQSLRSQRQQEFLWL